MLNPGDIEEKNKRTKCTKLILD